MPYFSLRLTTLHRIQIQLFPAASRQREEKIFRCLCLAFSYQHCSNLMWIFHPFYIYSHHWWQRTTESPSSVWFDIYQMRRTVTNNNLLKHHTPACLFLTQPLTEEREKLFFFWDLLFVYEYISNRFHTRHM